MPSLPVKGLDAAEALKDVARYAAGGSNGGCLTDAVWRLPWFIPLFWVPQTFHFPLQTAHATHVLPLVTETARGRLGLSWMQLDSRECEWRPRRERPS